MTRLSDELESDIRILMRCLRAEKHVEAFLLVKGGKLRVRSTGKPCQRIGRYVLKADTTWDELGEIVREDVRCARDQAFEAKGEEE